MEKEFNELKNVNFVFTENMKQTMFDILIIQKLLDNEKLDYKYQKELEREKFRLLNNFRVELQENNQVEVAIVRAFLQMKEDEK